LNVRWAQKMTRRGGARARKARKGSGRSGCRGAEHGQTCPNRTGAVHVALRAELESAVQLGRARVRRRSEQGSRNGQPYEMQDGAPWRYVSALPCFTRSHPRSPRHGQTTRIAKNCPFSAQQIREMKDITRYTRYD
jgi:hypothetical protein